MTKRQREKSVAIAKDVLSNIRLLNIKQGSYIVISNTMTAEDNGVQMQKLLPRILNNKKPCRVCALGACMLSHVKLFNKFKLESDDLDPSYLAEGEFSDVELGDDKFRGDLVKSMGEINVSLIECAFEQTYHHGNESIDQSRSAEVFGKQYSDPVIRLRKIMKNLIKNDGEFVPA